MYVSNSNRAFVFFKFLCLGILFSLSNNVYGQVTPPATGTVNSTTITPSTPQNTALNGSIIYYSNQNSDGTDGSQSTTLNGNISVTPSDVYEWGYVNIAAVPQAPYRVDLTLSIKSNGITDINNGLYNNGNTLDGGWGPIEISPSGSTSVVAVPPIWRPQYTNNYPHTVFPAVFNHTLVPAGKPTPVPGPPPTYNFSGTVSLKESVIGLPPGKTAITTISGIYKYGFTITELCKNCDLVNYSCPQYANHPNLIGATFDDPYGITHQCEVGPDCKTCDKKCEGFHGHYYHGGTHKGYSVQKTITVPINITSINASIKKYGGGNVPTCAMKGDKIQLDAVTVPTAKEAKANGDKIEYLWSFGDLTTSTLESPSHMFTYDETITLVFTINGINYKDTKLIQTYCGCPSSYFIVDDGEATCQNCPGCKGKYHKFEVQSYGGCSIPSKITWSCNLKYITSGNIVYVCESNDVSTPLSAQFTYVQGPNCHNVTSAPCNISYIINPPKPVPGN